MHASRDVRVKRYINRELSWIAFNQRVLGLALQSKSPLLEQAKYSAIFSNNLDEFFMVRVASLIAQLQSNSSRLSIDGCSAAEQLQVIHQQLGPLLN
jgi:polyphosphate kinase